MTLATVSSFVDVYIVQRCWLDGPYPDRPVDCQRLFLSRQEAEQEASRAAHAFFHFYKQHYAHARPVRTLLLPDAMTNMSSGRQSSSFAFSSCGKLFWVRKVHGAVAANISNSSVASPWPKSVPDHAFCIVTNDIIGGTGNRHSRRGSERTTECVSVECRHCTGDTCSCAYQLANLWMHQQLEQHNQQSKCPSLTTIVKKLPIGTVNNATLDDWPAVSLGVLKTDGTVEVPSSDFENYAEGRKRNNVVSDEWSQYWGQPMEPSGGGGVQGMDEEVVEHNGNENRGLGACAMFSEATNDQIMVGNAWPPAKRHCGPEATTQSIR